MMFYVRGHFLKSKQRAKKFMMYYIKGHFFHIMSKAHKTLLQSNKISHAFFIF